MFQKTEKERTVLNLFPKASIILIHKPDKKNKRNLKTKNKTKTKLLQKWAKALNRHFSKKDTNG